MKNGQLCEVRLEMEVQELATCLLELVPTQEQIRLRQLISSVLTEGIYWCPFWNLVFNIATINTREAAFTEINDDGQYDDEHTDLKKADMQVFNLLWPLAEQAHAIIERSWEAVQTVANDLLRRQTLNEDHAPARRPFLLN